MKPIFLVSLLAAVLSLGATSPSPLPQTASPLVYLAQIRGSINPAGANYLRSTIQKAERDGAQLVLIELDTPGGLISSVRDMAQSVSQSTVPVAVYVTPGGASATSAGALLMLASHVAVMAPGTNIGAAHPVGPQGEDIKGAMQEKATNDTAAFAKSLAATHQRNVELADQIVAKSKSFTADEAIQKKLIEHIASSREEALRQMHGRTVTVANRSVMLNLAGARVEEVKMNLGQSLLQTLADPNIAGLLMTLALVLLYVEISTPGAMVPGILGGICLLVAMMSFQMLPIRTGGIVLLLLGALLMLAEPFIISHGALAIGGIVSFVLGLIWAIDPAATTLTISPAVWVPAALGLGSVALLIGYAAARLKKDTQKTLAQMGGGALAGLAGYPGVVESVEADGRSGTALFRGELWKFQSAEPVQAGDKIEALGVEGMVVTVKRS